MDANKCKALQSQITAALQPILAQHGLTLTRNRASYSEDNVRLTLVLDTDSAARKRWEQLGLPDLFNVPVQFNGTVYRFVDANPRSKYPAIAEVDGRRYKVALATVQAVAAQL